MSWRTVVITGIAKLDYRIGYLVVRKKGAVSRIYLDEITMLILESTTISLTTTLISELSKKKVKVIFCDEKHNPESELQPYYGSHDTSEKVKKQIGWTQEIKKLVWTEIVSEKIRNQCIYLEEKGLVEQCNILKGYIHEIILGDETNREGHAAKVYFNALFGMDFTRTSDTLINAALNYGYSIILSYFNREVVSNGYITQLGLFHENMFNKFNLSSDLMEPFRIIVDRKVVNMNLDKFEPDEKMQIVNIINENIIMNGQVNTVANGIKIYTRSVFDALNEGDISLIKFYKEI
jgi:CRISPR-associated protein Cas1